MQIITDTASLFSPTEGKAAQITVVPACVIHKNQVYRDYEDISSEAFLEMVRAGAVPTTSQPAIGDLIEVFEETQEETLALFIGDGLSGGYQNAMGAKNSLDESKHIHILDTHTLAGAERYLVEKAIRLRDQGMPFEQILEALMETIQTSHSFVIPADFDFLKRSGRLTPIAAKLGAMVKIVPVLTQTEDRKKITLFVVKRSWKKATESILNQLQKSGVDRDYRIIVCHGGDVEAAEAVLAQVKQTFPETETELFSLSPTMITHGGPGCVLIQAIKK